MFHLRETPKQHRKRGKVPPPVTFTGFAEKTVCPVDCLEVYLRRTEEFRDGSRSRLLLTHIGDHKAVSRDTIRGWLKSFLGAAGVDTSLYQGHSVRAASSSSDFRKWTSMKEILAKGGWSRLSTWQRLYWKDV